MWYPLTATQPTTEPLSLDEVKRRLRIEHADDDDDIGLLIAAARDHVEKYCGLYLVPREVLIKCDAWADLESLPVGPVISVTALAYQATDGTDQTLTAFELWADGLGAKIVPTYGTYWPPLRPGSRITVTVNAGFQVIPPAIKHAMLLFIGDAYESRENAKMDDFTALDALLCNYRR